MLSHRSERPVRPWSILSLCALVLLAACADDATLQGPRTGLLVTALAEALPKLVDVDGDGYPVPDDCLDDGYVWTTGEPSCSLDTPVRFAPSDGANAKDFSLIERAGDWHVFHNRGFGSWLTGDNEVDFGHESSSDMVTWTAHPPLDMKGPTGSWNDRHTWAPHVIHTGNSYYMYFTGVSYDTDPSFNVQRIGVARSSDLENWSFLWRQCSGVSGWGCVLDCDVSWTSWSSGQPWEANCRDPYVIGLDGIYWMFLSTTLDDGDAVIAVASSSNGRSWTLQAPLLNTADYLAESPAVMEHQGQLFMFWTGPGGLRYAIGDSPMGTWTNQGLVNGTVGSSFANELVPWSDGTVLFTYAESFQVVFQRLIWNGPEFALVNNAVLACQLPASAVNPGAREFINGVDDDCDGVIDIKSYPPLPDIHMERAEKLGTPLRARW